MNTSRGECVSNVRNQISRITKMRLLNDPNASKK